MAGLRLGPLVRYVDWESGTSATVWVETDRACTVEIRCAGGGGGSARTFLVAGHHYALVVVTGLTPGSAAEYEVVLDGERAWPLPDSPLPPSTLHMPPVPATGAVVAFGSCRWAAPAVGGADPVGPDVLDTLAARLAADPDDGRPDVLVLLGDQVYADETSAGTRDWIARHRRSAGTGSDAPPDQVADYEEYTHLYDESWGDPELRWLLSTVPSCMIFDDHDVIDDWNTSAAWVADMRATSWWHERITGGLMSYWVYQHLGNLSPAELAEDALYAAVLAADDGTEVLRAFAERADADPASVRWSYRRDFGRTRLLMVDTRAARVLEEQHRAMLDAEEADWLRTQAFDDPAGVDHLLVGTSLPWLLPPMVHFAEGWHAALCRGERGPRWARFGEWLRRRADLEHWAAFTASFHRLTDTVAEVGRRDAAPATVCVLSGDVHHAYVAEPVWPAGQQPRSRVFQFTCSPLHNSVPVVMRVGFRVGWSRFAQGIGHLLALHGRVGRPAVRWERTGGPWFGNQLMTLTLRGRTARLRLEKASTGGKRARQGTDRAGARLVQVLDRVLTEDG
ncbi:alkaline phosphatase D family protein [Streptomyces sp. NPDC006553]|uniref:alkaline phosphatase D family protein n=1 Tax=unclassified Streptomyces TaxID=2593676 RepID=UPI002254EED4|nr:alkaline phosphatase D family protein [Streptomyces sp. NBC_00233]MCX5232642.1 alkaline phosphatase family protein [Streptomyces sp. NBC_00233]